MTSQCELERFLHNSCLLQRYQGTWWSNVYFRKWVIIIGSIIITILNFKIFLIVNIHVIIIIRFVIIFGNFGKYAIFDCPFIFEILNTDSIWPQIWKDHPKLCQKKYFHDDDVIDGVTGWPQSRPSIFLFKWNNNIFHDNLETSKDIIIKLPVHRYHELMTIII